ncbi:hypothetical protein BpHYR1_010579 [Brachionus plicatilis]|uniref:Uncharacterized protein n=1 Tax=Brachionus plicatilis TaxID=10195 RepID=A0A3M7QKX2_BRAPC|nr:hypothetical protein BpHYR1_010579 [Brachionus plicatilis]
MSCIALLFNSFTSGNVGINVDERAESSRTLDFLKASHKRSHGTSETLQKSLKQNQITVNQIFFVQRMAHPVNFSGKTAPVSFVELVAEKFQSFIIRLVNGQSFSQKQNIFY